MNDGSSGNAALQDLLRSLREQQQQTTAGEASAAGTGAGGSASAASIHDMLSVDAEVDDAHSYAGRSNSRRSSGV